MILDLDRRAPAPVEDLLVRIAKNGRTPARGALRRVPFDAGEKPLADLSAGEKLHVVQSAQGSASSLVDRLDALGLTPDVELQQVHLLIDHAGSGGAESFAEQFSSELSRRHYRVREIKAPCGRVRWDDHGDVFIAPSDKDEWLPSGPDLNYYTGPAVQEKHRRSSGPPSPRGVAAT